MRQPKEIIEQIIKIQAQLPKEINREHLAFRVSLEEMSELFRHIYLRSTALIQRSAVMINRRQGCTIDGMRVLLDTEIDENQKGEN
jgi:hypothetical protein